MSKKYIPNKKEKYMCVGWKDIEILPRKSGKPEVHLHGRALNVANRIGLKDIAISQTHSIEYAISVAVGNADQP